MMDFKLFIDNAFEDMFGNDMFDMNAWRKEREERGKVVNVKRGSSKSKLTLYHGFNKHPNSFNYEFDPSKSEQGLLWFTHNMISGYDPYEYAASRGKYVLTYELPIEKMYDEVTYENGTSEKKAPQDLVNQYNSTSNSRMRPWHNTIILLPRNWFFTYKTEKFIGTTEKIKVSRNMISLSRSEL